MKKGTMNMVKPPWPRQDSPILHLVNISEPSWRVVWCRRSLPLDPTRLLRFSLSFLKLLILTYVYESKNQR